MANSNTLLLSIRILLMSSGVVSMTLVALKLFVPFVTEFSVREIPAVFRSVSGWLKPPYLYFIINGIIISIAASSRFHRYNDDNSEDHTPPPVKVVVVEYEPQFPAEFRLVESLPAPEKTVDVFEEKFEDPRVFQEKSVVVEEKIIARELSNDEFVVSRTGSVELPDDFYFPMEKPPASRRFSHRKPHRAAPEGGRKLRVTRPRKQQQQQQQHDTLEDTWKMITEGRGKPPLTRNVNKVDTWENQGREMMETERKVMKKSETFRRRKEPSLSQDELNRRAEDFINRFNEQMRLQRQQSIEQNMQLQMVNTGSGGSQ